MPVRSLTSSVLKWPDRNEVDSAVRDWAQEQAKRRPTLIALGYFGSYARGHSGVGSDLDLVAVVESSRQAFEKRALDWDLNSLPVPDEILIYTRAEWDRLLEQDSRFARTLSDETVWVGNGPPV